MASFRCYDNSDVIATLIMTIFHLYLMQLWWQFFQMFVRYWPWKTVSRHFQYGLSCCIIMGLVSFRLFCKNLGNLQEFFGQMVYRPPGRKLPVRLWAPIAGEILQRQVCFVAIISENNALALKTTSGLSMENANGWNKSAWHAGLVFDSRSRIGRFLLIVL